MCSHSGTPGSRQDPHLWRGRGVLWHPRSLLSLTLKLSDYTRDTSSPHIVMKIHAHEFRLHLMTSVVRLQDISCEGGREGCS